MNEFIPHIHVCELKLLNRNLKKFCPHRGKISETENECDLCEHLIIIDFEDEEMTRICGVTRLGASEE